MTEETLALCRAYVDTEQHIGTCQDMDDMLHLFDVSAEMRVQLNAVFETHMGIRDMDRRCRNIIASCEMLQAGKTD